MNDPIKVDLYCLCWNEARIIPFFLRHYLPLVDRVFVFDNGSTDQSLALLAGDERIKVAHFDVRGDSFVDEERRLSDEMWKPSRGHANWVAVVDMDEHLHHPDLRAHLTACMRDKVTAVRATGYEMIANAFPSPEAMLHEAETNGFRYAESLDKFCLFNPDAITHSNFHAGRHTASPKGDVAWESAQSVKLLHYKQLGLDYLIERTRELRSGLRPGDLRRGWGAHYKRDEATLTKDFRKHQALARPVPGLGAPEAPPDIHLLMHGERIMPASVHRNAVRFDLPAGATALRIMSPKASVATPLLGVSIEGLVVYGDKQARDIPLDSPDLREGWWGATRADDRVTRWTSGNALVVVPGSARRARVLEVRLAG